MLTEIQKKELVEQLFNTKSMSSGIQAIFTNNGATGPMRLAEKPFEKDCDPILKEALAELFEMGSPPYIAPGAFSKCLRGAIDKEVDLNFIIIDEAGRKRMSEIYHMVRMAIISNEAKLRECGKDKDKINEKLTSILNDCFQRAARDAADAAYNSKAKPIPQELKVSQPNIDDLQAVYSPLKLADDKESQARIVAVIISATSQMQNSVLKSMLTQTVAQLKGQKPTKNNISYITKIGKSIHDICCEFNSNQYVSEKECLDTLVGNLRYVKNKTKQRIGLFSNPELGSVSDICLRVLSTHFTKKEYKNVKGKKPTKSLPRSKSLPPRLDVEAEVISPRALKSPVSA